LGENRYFRDGDEIVIIPRDPVAIAEQVLAQSDDPARLLSLRQKCQRAFAARYSYAAQLAPRIAVLEQHARMGA
jgi:hypothetical protein